MPGACSALACTVLLVQREEKPSDLSHKAQTKIQLSHTPSKLKMQSLSIRMIFMCNLHRLDVIKYCKAVLPCDVPAVLAIPIPYLHRLNQNTGLKPRAVVYLVKLCQDEFAQ